MEKSKSRESKGSYDEVFGVSCALLWLRARYLGSKNEDTQRTLKWIRNNIRNYEDREKTLAYLTLINIGLVSNDEIKDLKKILLSKIDNIIQQSELNLILYLRAAVAIKLNEIIIPTYCL